MGEGALSWARAMNGELVGEGAAIAVDNDGHAYITGGFRGTVDFDPGEEVFELTATGTSDIFVQKLDQDGGLVWARAMGDTGFDHGYGIAVDKAGNVYVTGSFTGTVDFDPGLESFELTAEGIDDIFVLKLDTDGKLVWALSMAGPGIGFGTGIAVDGEGYVYTTGIFYEEVDFDPGPGEFELGSQGFSDFFVHKLDNDGKFVWARAIGGEDADESFDIAVDERGNVYTTGFFQTTVDFDPGEGTFELKADGDGAFFVLKLDTDGDFVWARAMVGSDFGQGFGIAVDSAENVYTTGTFDGAVDFDPGDGVHVLTSEGFSDIFVHKLDVDGNFVWARAMGGTGSCQGFGIAVDDAGNAYTTGAFQATVDFDPGPGTFELEAVGNHDIFVQKLDSDGHFVWARAMGGTGTNQGFGIAVDSEGYVYATGSFEDTVDFDPGPGIFELESAGSRSIFVLKLSQTTGEFTPFHSADQDGDGVISLSELLRVIQFFNSGGYHCVVAPATSEDGYLPGVNVDARACLPHASDYNPQDWVISLSELLRLIQFFNSGSYTACPELETEDGFCSGLI